MPVPAFRSLPVAFACVLFTACGGGGGGAPAAPAPPPPTYTIGGTLSGLAGTGLVLRNNAGNDLVVAAPSSSFTFPTALASGAAYNVTVAAQPTNPSQTCAVTGGGGTVGSANVTAVQIACTTNSFTVSATVTGLDANGLVLQNNGGSDLAVASDGTVTFPGQTSSGAPYAITVLTQPTVSPFPLPAQFCTATNGSGTVGNGPVNVAITCAAPAYKFLYVSNRVGNDISAYAVNVNTGELTAVPGSPFGASVQPLFGNPEPSGRFLYVANQGDATNPPRVSAYTVDADTGALDELDGSPFDWSVTPQPMGDAITIPVPLMHHSGAFAYAAATVESSNSKRLFGVAINSLTGALTEINGFPLDAGFSVGGGPGQDSTGRILFVTTNPVDLATTGEIRTFEINSPSGTLTPVGAFPTVNADLFLPILTPNDNFLLALGQVNNTLEVFRVSKSNGIPNGVLEPIGLPVSTGPAGTRPGGVTINRRNHVLYIASRTLGGGPSSLAAFRLDPSTGVLTEIGTPISTNGASGGALLHPSGRFLMQNNTGHIQIIALDPTTFAPTLQPNPSPLAEVLGSLRIDFSGKYLYTSNPIANSVSSYRIDQTTGTLTFIHTVPAGLSPSTISPFGFQPQ
jgi:6-phosphogluconolactonase (cycloisomerase 2 family)